MSKRESIARYNLIINKPRKRPATFKEIERHLEIESDIQGYDFLISKRTFQRDLEDIRSIYQIDIQYNFSQKKYFIEYDEQPQRIDRILEAFDTFNALNLVDRISNLIHFEDKKPQGTAHLHGVLHAIKNKLQVKFGYQKYWEDDPMERTVEPYTLKEFKNRWYLFSRDSQSLKLRTFALDRMSDLEISKVRFEVPEFLNLDQYFEHCYGIISPENEDPAEVVLSFDSYQGNYIKSLPLHRSQEILLDDYDELRIRLKVYLTEDFLMELLSYGSKVKVIEPVKLQQMIVDTYRKALSNYQ